MMFRCSVLNSENETGEGTKIFINFMKYNWRGSGIG